MQTCIAETEIEKGNAEGQLKEIETELQQIAKRVEEKSSRCGSGAHLRVRCILVS